MEIGLWNEFPTGYIPEWLDGSAWGTSPTGLYPHEGIKNSNFELLINQLSDFSTHNRSVLCDAIEKQSAAFMSEIQLQALDQLKDKNTFTVVTGQQIHIGLGPLYVIFKIATAIQLAQELSKNHPNHKFIPVFWMATEDHDFQEVSKINLFGKQWDWPAPESNIPVGRLQTNTIKKGLQWVKDFFQNNSSALASIEFLEHLTEIHPHSFADFTAHFVCHLFADFHLLVLNPDDKALKTLAKPIFEKDLFSSELFNALDKQSVEIQQYGLAGPAYFRACNLFFTGDGVRERIEKSSENEFIGVDTGWNKSIAEMKLALEQNPEYFSPNVLLRPLYQQVILPNIAYVAGPSEYQYWLQTTKAFESMNLIAPALIHRKGGTVLSPSSNKKLNRFGVTAWEMFGLSDKEIQNHILKSIDHNFQINAELGMLNNEFQKLFEKLYHWQSPHLKALKKTAEQFEKEAKRAAKEAQEAALEKHFSEIEWKSFLELKSQQFNVKNPLERSFSWLQLYLSMPNHKDFLSMLTYSLKFEEEKFWLVQP